MAVVNLKNNIALTGCVTLKTYEKGLCRMKGSLFELQALDGNDAVVMSLPTSGVGLVRDMAGSRRMTGLANVMMSVATLRWLGFARENEIAIDPAGIVHWKCWR